MRRDWRRILRNPGVTLVGGLALGGLGIGLLIAILVFVIQPASTPEQAGMVRYRSGRFILWYDKDSDARAAHERLAASLVETTQRLATELDVADDLLPGAIDVFVYDDLQAMQSGIASRKSTQSRAVYEAPLDLLAGEDPTSRLAELVLAFGWGRGGSQILREGMRVVAADPARDYYAVTAALPDRLFLTLAQLARLEEEGRLPRTLYEQYDAPYSPATIGSLADLRQLLTLSTGGTLDLSTLQCASFVQYLVETHGISAVRGFWSAPNTGRLAEAAGAPSIPALEEAWRAAAVAAGKGAPDYPRLRAEYLLESGDPDAAYTLTSSWPTNGLSGQDLAVAARCAFAVGAFAEASQLAAQAQGQVRAQLGPFVTLYLGWEARTDRRIRVLAPKGAAERTLSIVRGALPEMASRLGLGEDALPPRLTVFVYPDAASQHVGEALTSLPSDQSAILHLLATDDPRRPVAEMLPAYAWEKDTYSKLLRDGVAAALSRDEDALKQAGCALREAGRWYPLGQVDYGAVGPETVEVEIGLMIDYLLDRFGPATLEQIWTYTSPLDRYMSLDGALEEACGITRNDINEFLALSFLQCD